MPRHYNNQDHEESLKRYRDGALYNGRLLLEHLRVLPTVKNMPQTISDKLEELREEITLWMHTNGSLTK